MSTLRPFQPASIAPSGSTSSRSGHTSPEDSVAGDSFRSRNGADGGHPEIRVVLVGRTGLDAALRRDPGVELVRTHHPLGAIGELANPIDAESTVPTVVIVAADALPRDRTKPFVQALRRVDPKVRVFALSGQSGDSAAFSPDAIRRLIRVPAEPAPPQAPPALPPRALEPQAPPGPSDDGYPVLDDDLPPSATAPPDSAAPLAPETDDDTSEYESQGPSGLSLVREPEAQAAPVEPSAESPPYSETAPEPDAAAEPQPATAEHVAAAGIGAPLLDTAPVAALLEDRDPIPHALDTLREIASLPDLDFIRAEPTASLGPPQQPHITLIHAGNVLGYLTSDGQLTALSPDQVRWLTTWIALSARCDQLREFAFTDELTGAYNRRYFNRFMSRALPEAVASRRYLTLLFFDIDDFKLYNDRFGHAAGDEILVHIVSLLKSVIRPSDRVCRIGGDEFVVVFYDPPTPAPARSHAPSEGGHEARMGAAPQSIATIAERFQRQICQHRFPKLAELAPGTLTVSGGMATFPWDGRTDEELLARADELAMQSKAQGKNLITLGPGAERVCHTLH